MNMLDRLVPPVNDSNWKKWRSTVRGITWMGLSQETTGLAVSMML
jgi:hypothetical protein